MFYNNKQVEFFKLRLLQKVNYLLTWLRLKSPSFLKLKYKIQTEVSVISYSITFLLS